MASSKSFQQLYLAPLFARLQYVAYVLLLSIVTQALSVPRAASQSASQSPSRRPAAVATTKKQPLQSLDSISGTKLHGGINAFGMACVSTGVIPLSTELPTTVEDVKKGSRAFYAGVMVGDRILQATIENNQLKLKIERNGHIYLASMQAQMDTRRPLSLGLEGDRSLTSVLRSFKIRLIVDHSGSMYRPLGNSDKYRWAWVKEELDRFCNSVQKQTASPLDLYLFNEDVDVFANQSASQISSILTAAVTTGNTNLPAALRLATADSRQPLLIILVTDGLAVSSRENAAILAENLSRTPTLRQSKIIFLQAGYSAEGANFVASLNDALVARGMGKRAYPVLFEEASRKGILGAIEPILMQ
ncbi:MAG: VWA domain-containing protein [Candidatus Obscuribacterales bacterium]|jgi:hypothetical protein